MKTAVSLMLATIAVVTAPSPAGADVRLQAPATLLAGERPQLRVTGLPPLAAVTLESFRIHPTPMRESGQWSTRPLAYHASATFWADDAGTVEVDAATPVVGTYSGVDPRGLLWSGKVVGRGDEPPLAPTSPELADLGDGQVRLRVRVGGQVVATRELAIIDGLSSLTEVAVDTPALVGAFAAPRDARHAPVVVLLHGSEGGDPKSARRDAARWASHGFAAFALIYFSWPDAHVPNAPQAFTRLPLERIATVRDWLRARPEANPDRLALAGGSKGAEFALLAATRYPWVQAVAACVPSSIVWGGFGADDAHDNSFTWQGVPVANVPYGDYGPVLRGEITSAERHRRDRAAALPGAVARASIPVEESRARILLISGGRDAIWPSDAMAAEIVARLRQHGDAARVTWKSFPDAGHFLCGTGDRPIRANEADEAGLGGGLPSADGRDPGTAWEATLAFVQEALDSGPGAAGADPVRVGGHP